MFMHRIKLENILSFGPDAQELKLKPLNVLIGPNGSGKSNLIEVIGLLRAAPSDVMAPIREGGGGDNWIWRGERNVTEARVEVDVVNPFGRSDKQLLRYSLAFGPFFFGLPSLKEEIGEVERTERRRRTLRTLPSASKWPKVTLTYLGREREEKPA